MKILLINWAPIDEAEKTGGGVNVYCHAMAHAYQNQGHEVISLISGYHYDRFGFNSKIRLDKIKSDICPSYSIVNSPIPAPAWVNFRYPKSEIQNGELERVFEEAINTINPDIVHFNNIEGLTFSCIHKAKQIGKIAFYSLHNYHTVCSQVLLLHKTKTLCEDYDKGLKCAGCVNTVPFKIEFGSKSYRLPSRMRHVRGVSRLTNIYDKFIFKPATSRQFKKTHATDFMLRRQAAVKALNACDKVFAVSEFVRDKYLELGVDFTNIQCQHIGTPLVERCREARATREPFYNESHPIRFCFIGSGVPAKGLNQVLEAFLSMDEEILSTIELTVAGFAMKRHAEALDQLKDKLRNLEVMLGYDHKALPDILKKCHIGIATPLWWDNAPQVVMEMMASGIPVIGTRMGGIPDFVEDEVNGFLVAPNDSAAIKESIERFIANPKLINKMSAHCKDSPVKTVKEHADEMLMIFERHRGRGI